MTQLNGPLRIGIGGPVGAGKTTLTAALAAALKDQHSIGVITNDIYTQEDAEELMRRQILPRDRIIGVETGGCRTRPFVRMHPSIWLRSLKCAGATPRSKRS